MRDAFGTWVRDVELTPPEDWSRMKRLWLHSSYWKKAEKDNAKKAATPLALLRQALDLDVLQKLQKENRAHSPIMYLEEPKL